MSGATGWTRTQVLGRLAGGGGGVRVRTLLAVFGQDRRNCRTGEQQTWVAESRRSGRRLGLVHAGRAALDSGRGPSAPGRRDRRRTSVRQPLQELFQSLPLQERFQSRCRYKNGFKAVAVVGIEKRAMSAAPPRRLLSSQRKRSAIDPAIDPALLLSAASVECLVAKILHDDSDGSWTTTRIDPSRRLGYPCDRSEITQLLRPTHGPRRPRVPVAPAAAGRQRR